MTGNAMGGSSHSDTMAAAEFTMPGRHRPHGPDTWTPAVPRRTGGNHRRRPGPDKTDPSAIGAFPPPRGEQPDARTFFPSARGTLPSPQGHSDFLTAPLPQPQKPPRTTPADDAFRPTVSWRDAGALPQVDDAFRAQRPPPVGAGFQHGHGGEAFRPQHPYERGDNTFPSQHPRGRDDEAFRPPAAGWADTGVRPQRFSQQHQLAEPQFTGFEVRRERDDFGSAPVSGRLPGAPAPRNRRELLVSTSASLLRSRGSDEEQTSQSQPQWAEYDEDLLPFGDEGDEGDETDAAQVSAEPPQRQRVILRTPTARLRQREEDDEVRVYAAPAVVGLGTFDLGSVPASVTPPKSWRKAAWFATGASGAVVVGLLFAGTFLVGGPTTTTEALGGGWPGQQNGVSPLLIPHTPTSHHGGTAGETHHSSTNHTSSRWDSATDGPRTRPETAGNSGSPSYDVTSSDPMADGSSSGPVTTDAAAGAPRKPPVTPALRETEPPDPYYSTAVDTQKMGDNSEKFFNTVTTDPGQASAVTTGQLHDQGAKRLRERYSDVAYFEVKRVAIDPDRNVTVNTVEVTHTDGSKSTEQRTLTFGDGEKITDDGA